MWTTRVVPSVVNVCACSLSPLLSPRRVVLSCELEGSNGPGAAVQIDGERPGGNASLGTYCEMVVVFTSPGQ
jgi:hypothetical protein